jgi:hypothetical protein
MASFSSAKPPFVLLTDNGTHPADKWADMIAKLCFPISEDIAQNKWLLANAVQAQIAVSISGLVQKVLDIEHRKLLDDDRLLSPYDVNPYVNDALTLIYTETDKSLWAEYMRSMEKPLRDELTRQFTSIQHVERLYYAEHNQDLETARAYRARFNQ